MGLSLDSRRTRVPAASEKVVNGIDRIFGDDNITLDVGAKVHIQLFIFDYTRYLGSMMVAQTLNDFEFFIDDGINDPGFVGRVLNNSFENTEESYYRFPIEYFQQILESNVPFAHCIRVLVETIIEDVKDMCLNYSIFFLTPRKLYQLVDINSTLANAFNKV